MRLFRGQEPAPIHGTPLPVRRPTQQRAPSDQIFRHQGESLMLQPTPPGFTRTPPGAIDAQMFTEEKPPHVSFDNDMNAPYDESAAYLRRSDTRLV